MFSGSYMDTYAEICAKQLGNLDKGAGGGLERIMKEFPPFSTVLSLCATRYQTILFLQGKLLIGTPRGPEETVRACN